MPAKKLITKKMILNTAFDILKNQGYEAINITFLAKRLHCSTQPIYLSFFGMEELREELIPMAVKKFEEYMYGNSKNSVIHLYDIPYINFAKNEPHLFYFLFMRANAFEETKKIVLPIIEKSIVELMNLYNLNHNSADELHDNLWMHAHGIASMIATNFCNWDMKKVSTMLDSCKSAFLKNYEK